MQGNERHSAQQLLSLWREKAGVLDEMLALTRQILAGMDDDSEEAIALHLETRAQMMARIDLLDEQAGQCLAALRSTSAMLSPDIDAETRGALEEARSQMRDALVNLQPLNTQLEAAVSNRISEISEELRETKTQIFINNEYNILSDEVQSTFDTRS